MFVNIFSFLGGHIWNCVGRILNILTLLKSLQSVITIWTDLENFEFLKNNSCPNSFPALTPINLDATKKKTTTFFQPHTWLDKITQSKWWRFFASFANFLHLNNYVQRTVCHINDCMVTTTNNLHPQFFVSLTSTIFGHAGVIHLNQNYIEFRDINQKTKG